MMKILRRFSHFRMVTLLLIASLLSSCVAAVVAGAAAGMVVYDRRSVGTLESDARIFHMIHTRIVNDQTFRDSRIIVISFNKVVLLIGQTPQDHLREEAFKIARNTPDVRRVYNEISIDNPLSLGSKAQDSLITGQVRTAMLNKKGLESGSIRIVTEGGVVYLMGIVTHEQANLAVDVARQVSSVVKVVKVFQYY